VKCPAYRRVPVGCRWARSGSFFDSQKHAQRHAASSSGDPSESCWLMSQHGSTPHHIAAPNCPDLKSTTTHTPFLHIFHTGAFPRVPFLRVREAGRTTRRRPAQAACNTPRDKTRTRSLPDQKNVVQTPACRWRGACTIKRVPGACLLLFSLQFACCG
jgi:hypothetical protein